MDLIALTIAILLFAAAVLYTLGCDRLKGTRS